MNDPRAHRSVESNGLPFDKIFGSGSYKYSLILAETLPKILYKERNFNLNVLLIDNASNMVCNTNHIPISLCAYTSDAEPQILMDTKCGKSMFRGTYETQLIQGVAHYSKIQFREVTSYYKNGWIYFVICPKPMPFAYKSNDTTYENYVNWQLIKPLVLSEIVVKAKKKL